MKLAGAGQPMGAMAAFVTWNACSSIAHGELRGQLAYLTNTPMGTPEPGMQLNSVTGNIVTGDIKLMNSGCMIAIGTTREALRLYEKRSGTKIPV